MNLDANNLYHPTFLQAILAVSDGLSHLFGEENYRNLIDRIESFPTEALGSPVGKKYSYDYERRVPGLDFSESIPNNVFALGQIARLAHGMHESQPRDIPVAFLAIALSEWDDELKVLRRAGAATIGSYVYNNTECIKFLGLATIVGILRSLGERDFWTCENQKTSHGLPGRAALTLHNSIHPFSEFVYHDKRGNKNAGRGLRHFRGETDLPQSQEIFWRYMCLCGRELISAYLEEFPEHSCSPREIQDGTGLPLATCRYFYYQDISILDVVNDMREKGQKLFEGILRGVRRYLNTTADNVEREWGKPSTLRDKAEATFDEEWGNVRERLNVTMASVFELSSQAVAFASFVLPNSTFIGDCRRLSSFGASVPERYHYRLGGSNVSVI